MGFFGELKQDLSQVAGDELKREQADAEAERILADAELAGLDEAELASKRSSSEGSIPEDDNDDVAALLKDLVAGLGSGDETEAGSIDHSSDISDDINSILAGLTPDTPLEDKGSIPESADENAASDSAQSGNINEAFDLAIASLKKAEGSESDPAAEDAEETAEKTTEETGAAEQEDAYDKETAPVTVPTDEAAETVNETSVAEAAAVTGEAQTKEAPDSAVLKEVFKMEEGTFSEETSVITEGMVINGNIESAGNLDIMGKVNGNVTVRGKLNVTGCIAGNSTAKEIYAENARIIGDINSESSVKVGAGTVVVGNIYAFGAAIAGAVKGDIDVHGPVILDSTAIVKGNIRSKSVQINNGAALEGVCSQAYAEVSPTAFFDDFKPEGND